MLVQLRQHHSMITINSNNLLIDSLQQSIIPMVDGLIGHGRSAMMRMVADTHGH